MKKTTKGILTLTLAAAICAGPGGAMAYNTPDFADVAAGNWAYEPVMRMADAGIIKGTSATQFDPEGKVSAAMWVTLLGRVAFEEDAQAATVDGDSWYSAYMRVAEARGLLAGTGIAQEAPNAEVTRYDMAVVLRGVTGLLGVQEAAVDTSKITDYGEMPTKYAGAVAQVYALGLITGNQQGYFNGTATMGRGEAAAVLDRLLKLKEAQEEEANKPIEPETPRTGELVTFTVEGMTTGDIYDRETHMFNGIPGVTVVFYYKDGRELARGISGEDGRFQLEVTVDKADYSERDNVYYVKVDGINPATGNEYTGYTTTSSLYQNRVRTSNPNGWEIAVH